MRCEDYPCCGHELGCCPDFDEDGNQLDMKCVCGASVPLNNHVSICNGCLRSNQNYYSPFGDDEEYYDDYECDDYD